MLHCCSHPVHRPRKGKAAPEPDPLEPSAEEEAAALQAAWERQRELEEEWAHKKNAYRKRRR